MHPTSSRHGPPLLIASNFSLCICRQTFFPHLSHNIIPEECKELALRRAKRFWTAVFLLCKGDRSLTAVIFFSHFHFSKRKGDPSTNFLHNNIFSFSLLSMNFYSSSYTCTIYFFPFRSAFSDTQNGDRSLLIHQHLKQCIFRCFLFLTVSIRHLLPTKYFQYIIMDCLAKEFSFS